MNTPKEYIEIEKGDERYQHASATRPSAVVKESEEDEIDLLELSQQIWARRKTILYAVLVCFVLGLFVALVSPTEYSTEIILMPQTSTSNSGGTSSFLKQIGGFAGINIGEPTGTLDKTVYPDITQSTPFYLSLMEQATYFPTTDTTMTLYHYFAEIDTPPLLEQVRKYTLGLPRMLINLPIRIFSSFKSPPAVSISEAVEKSTLLDTINNDTAEEIAYQPVSLNGTQLGVLSKLRERVTTTIEANGMVKVSSEMPDPLVSAFVTESAVKYLTSYVKDYRIEKLQANVSFIEKQFEEKESRYNQAQQRYALLRDRNANIVTEQARIELERAQTEYNLAFGLYQSVANQLEQAKVRVQEETPVFKVLEPIQVPLRPSKPNKELIILLSIFAGIVIGFGIILMKIFYQNLKPKISD